MKRYLVLIFVVLMGLILVFAFAPGKKITDIKDLDLSVKKQGIKSMGTVKPDLDFGKIPLYFITNKGQVNEKAKFYAKASRYTLWLTKEGLVFDSTKKAGEGEQTMEDRRQKTDFQGQEKEKFARDVSRFIFLGANQGPEMVPVEEAKLRVNYFIGNDKSKWHCDIPASRAVLYKNLYKKIDLKVYGLEQQIEYDWIVKTGGDPGEISFEYKNVKGTRIDEEGNLLIETEFGELMHKKPVSYQKRTAPSADVGAGLRACPKERKYIDVTFKKIAANTYGFEVGAYDRSRELIIDPVVLAYSTYLGAWGNNSGYGIAVDAGGYVYVTGDTDNSGFPILNQYQGDQSGWDAFVTKLDPTQSGNDSLIYSTYLGGSGGEIGYGIAIDASGNAYVTGTTDSTDFPTLNQYQTFQSGQDAFVAKLDTNQSGVASLLYSTYLGSGGGGGVYSIDQGCAVAVDSNGYVYVTGETWTLYCQDFPTLNQYQDAQGVWDVFVTKLDPTQSGTSSLLYSTYLGGGK